MLDSVVLLGIFIVIAALVYRKKKDKKASKKPEPVTTPEPKEEWNTNLQYSHWNPSAWTNKGVALIHGLDEPDLLWVKINNEFLALHGNRDKGRQVWANYKSKANNYGTITAQDTNGVKYKISVHNNGVNRGPKWGLKREGGEGEED